MYCKNCGAELSDQARFCTECGTKVEERQNTTPQQVENVESQTDTQILTEEQNCSESQKISEKEQPDSMEVQPTQEVQMATDEQQSMAGQNAVETTNDTEWKADSENDKDSEEAALPELDLKGVFDEEPKSETEHFSEAVQQRLYEMDEMPQEEQPEFGGAIPESVNLSFQQPNDFSVEQEQDKAPKNTKKSGMFIGITVAAALVLFLASAALTGFFVSKNIDQKNAELKAEIAAEMNTYLDFCDKAKEYKDKFSKFYMEDSQESQLNKKLEQAKEQIVNRADATQLENWLKDMKQFASDTETENIRYTETLEDKFSDYDTLLMTAEEEKNYNERLSKFKEYVKKEDYASAVKYANESYEYGSEVTQEKSGWNVSVIQQDISSYPTVRLYLDVTDGDDQVIENVNKKYFILSEQQGADEKYLKQEITKATQLNQAERLNISMVADVSGSMDMNMPRVQDVMSNFLDNVQFDVGDQIELSSFDDAFQIEEYFTSDRASLVDRVYELEADGGTKLYDSLIEAAQRAYLQEGARCVIAFTDGLDNCSASTEDEVIDYASQYNVPIFIIGIGVGQDYEYQETLRRIAEETGGSYYDVDDVSESMEEVYNSIYRQQKEVYCVEYTTDADISMANTRNVHLYIKGEENGGMADYSYTPKDDYFGVLLGKMLNAYSRAVENKDYSYLEDSKTIKSGGGIDTDWRSYVKKESLEISQILNYEVLGLEFKDENTCIMTTRESYDITQTKNYNSDIKKQRKKKSDTDAVQIYDLLTNRYYEEDLEDTTIEVKKTRVLKGTYKLVRSKNGEWKFRDFADTYKVESSDVYSACVEGDYDNWE